MIQKFLTAVCLMSILAFSGCGDPKKTENKTDKTDKTGKEAKTGDDKTGDDKNAKTMKNDETKDDEGQKTDPSTDESGSTTGQGDRTNEESDPAPTLVPEIDPTEDAPANQETGSAEKSDGPELNVE